MTVKKADSCRVVILGVRGSEKTIPSNGQPDLIHIIAKASVGQVTTNNVSGIDIGIAQEEEAAQQKCISQPGTFLEHEMDYIGFHVDYFRISIISTRRSLEASGL